MSFVPHWIAFALLRISVGFCHPGIFVIAVVIGMELVGPEKRKVAGVITGTFYAVGQVRVPRGRAELPSPPPFR